MKPMPNAFPLPCAEVALLHTLLCEYVIGKVDLEPAELRQVTSLEKRLSHYLFPVSER